jgi:hypothetical protein
MGNPNFEQMQDAQEMGDVAQALNQSVPGGSYLKPDTRNLSDWYMEFEDDLQHMQHWLKGEFFDPSDELEPWKKKGEALVNESGVVFILGYIRGTGLSKNKIMSNFPNWDQAMIRIRDVCFGLNEALHKHYCIGDWGLELSNISAINKYAFDLVFSSTLRALFGNENKRVRDTNTTATSIVTGGGQGGNDPTRPRSPLEVLTGR